MSQAFQHTGKEHWGLYCVVGVEVAPAALRSAWRALRIEYPGLGVVAHGYEAEYCAATPESVESWTNETFHVEHAREADNLIAEYKLHDLPGLYYFPLRSEVLLLSSHWRTDAIGCCHILRRLFQLAADPTQSFSTTPSLGHWPVTEQLKRLSPSMEDAAGSPLENSPKINSMTEKVMSNFEQKAGGALGLQYKGENDTPPGRSAYEMLKFSKQASQELFTACKRQKLSVSAAVYAALGATILDIHEDDVSEFATIMAVNMRPHLLPAYRTAAHACQVYVTSITPTVDRSDNFLENATNLTQYFRSWHSEDFNLAIRQIYSRGSQALISRGTAPRDANGAGRSKPPQGVTLSSLGIVDDLLCAADTDSASLPTLRVKSFRFGVSMLTRQMLLYVWTFGGELHLSVSYNEAYHDAAAPAGLLQRIRTELEGQLRDCLR